MRKVKSSLGNFALRWKLNLGNRKEPKKLSPKPFSSKRVVFSENRNNFLNNCILVGGIYTVIRSKSFVSTEEMGDQYCLIGPYKEYSARTEVELTPLINPKLNKAVEKLNNEGFKVCTAFLIQNEFFNN